MSREISLFNSDTFYLISCFIPLNVGTFETNLGTFCMGSFWCDAQIICSTRRWHHRYGRIRSTLGTSSTPGLLGDVNSCVFFFERGVQLKKLFLFVKWGGGFSWSNPFQSKVLIRDLDWWKFGPTGTLLRCLKFKRQHIFFLDDC